MEEIEVPTEHLSEAINEKAEEAREEKEKEKAAEKKWSMMVAVSTALMAVIAAIAGLMAGDHANEAVMSQIKASVSTIKASDQWNYYQAKGIKAEVRQSQKDTASVTKYKTEQQDISTKAKGFEDEATKSTEEAEHLLKQHVPLAMVVTFFQVAIAVSAISIISGKRFLWYLGLALSVAGICFFVYGLMV